MPTVSPAWNLFYVHLCFSHALPQFVSVADRDIFGLDEISSLAAKSPEVIVLAIACKSHSPWVFGAFCSTYIYTCCINVAVRDVTVVSIF